jgi:hypothetical protein
MATKQEKVEKCIDRIRELADRLQDGFVCVLERKEIGNTIEVYIDHLEKLIKEAE